MTWPTLSTTPETGPAERIELGGGEGRDELMLVGPSLRGWIYRSASRPACYRVLPMQEAPLELRAEATSWKDRARRPGLAPVVHAAQDYERGFFFIQYEMLAERTLQDVLEHPNPATRLEAAARTAEAAVGWLKVLGSGFLPMPADIVFGAGGSPILLAVPTSETPPLDCVFAEPSRALYLAPEAMCGRAGVKPEALDRYALGMALLRCFYRIPAREPEEVLRQAVNGTALEADSLESSLPVWLDSSEGIEPARTAVLGLVDRDPEVRAGLDLHRLAGVLAECSQLANPLRTVVSTAAARGPAAALELAEEILPEDDSFELLAEAGRLAVQSGRTLEAIDFFERAIGRNPVSESQMVLSSDRPSNENPDLQELFESQLLAITALVSGASGIAPAKRTSVLEKLDAILLRDFQGLSPQKQTDHEEAIARYHLEREDFEKAASFIHPRLFEGDKYIWWKFDMTLAYTEALMGLGDIEEARRMLTDIKQRLAFVRKNRSVPEDEIARYGSRVDELERRLLQLRKK
jgi:tetratricopeptide (TPR) repeat protein